MIRRIQIRAPKSTPESRNELCNAALANPELSVTELAVQFQMRRDSVYGILRKRGITRHRVPVSSTGEIIPGVPMQPQAFTDAMHRHTVGTATKEDEEFTDACIKTMAARIRARNPHTDPQRGENDWMPAVVPAPGQPIEESLI